ncbi:MAG: glycosyltransferase family 2 protein [Pseudomonadota bacterium]
MINVIVPTFNRPDGLLRAVRSLFTQSLSETGFNLIIVDNTPSATAASAIAQLRTECPSTITLITLHEPNAGVANARNTAMSAVEGNLVAFLDDDQSAPRDWLEQFLAAYNAHPAACTFGPVRTVLPQGVTQHTLYFERFFAREPDLPSGYIETSYGCGNALIDFAQIDGGAPWFDVRMNEMGGEDDLLFSRIERSGGRFAWAGAAPVFEHPPEERVTLAYTLRRAFSYGQAPLTLALKSTPKRYERVPVWMAIGAAKALWHGLQWGALTLVRHKGRAFQLDLAIRGLSKIVWWVDLKFYGVAALKRSETGPDTALEPPVPATPKRA